MAADAKTLLFYDLRSRAPTRCFSANTWKVRLLLNYKKIPYRTEWVEFRDVESVIKPLGVAPSSTGGPAYTVPTVVFPDGTVTTDSAAIATEVQRRYPNPPVLNLPTHSSVQATPEGSELPVLAPRAEWYALHANLSGPLRLLIPARGVDIVTEYSRPTKLAELGGRTPDEIEAGIDMDLLHKELDPNLRKMSAFWQTHAEVVTVDGKLTWTAVHQLSSLQSVRVIAPDIFEYLVGADGGEGLKRIYDAAKEKGWFDRDDF